jgi:hypothetical protein
MSAKVISLRVLSEDVVKWLESKKKTGHSINTEINKHLEAAMKKDKSK